MALGSALRARLSGAGLDVELADDAIARLDQYLTLRSKWGRTHNIAGPMAMANPILTDLVDGAAVTRVLTPETALVDVGAGSGTPGLVVAAIEPGRPVWLVEPLAKRTAFLRTVLASMGLPQVRVQRARWPVELDAEVQVVSRAVVPPARWPTLAIAGGPKVSAVLRMLAKTRPPFAVPGWHLAAAVDYALDDAERRVERWERSP